MVLHAGMMLPSVVSAEAATSCLVQMQFPSAYLCSVLGQRLPGIKSAYGIFGDRVPDGTSVSRRFGAARSSSLQVSDKPGLVHGLGLRCHRFSTREVELGTIAPHAVQDHPDSTRQSYSCALLSAPLGNIPRPGG